MKENQDSSHREREISDILKAQQNKKLFLGLIAIFLGGFGLHKFLLGHTKEGIIQLASSLLCGLGGFIGLVEGILYITKSDEEFNATYIVGDKKWF